MNQFNTNSGNEVGYIIVTVSTARGAIPLADASVSIRGDTPETSGIIRTAITNSDGKTERIALPTPDRALSGTPNDPKPFATYNIDVFKDGYIPLYFRNVPVFSSVLSIQPAVMVPISTAENSILFGVEPQIYTESQNPNL